MKTIYEFGVCLPLGKLLNQVKELEESINTHLAKDGWEEKLSIGYTQTGTVEVEREMTEKEIETMKEHIHAKFSEAFGSAKVEYFRRKSGNVLQSAS